MARREYAGAAAATTLNGAITNVATALVLTNGTGYPLGAGGNFVLTISPGLASEEKVLCSARSGNNVTVVTRGYDGTTAAAHDNGATVQHTISAVDLDEANAHVNSTGNPHPQYALAPTLAEVATSETTSSSSYTNLTTTGPAVTVTVGASGKLKIELACCGYLGAVTDFAIVSFALSGANTLAASDTYPLAILSPSTSSGPDMSTFFVLTGLTPGSTTVTMKYRTNGGTAGNFRRRRLMVTAL